MFGMCWRVIGTDRGPKHWLVALRYAGWGPGQLEGELEREDWILDTVHADDIFSSDPDHLWATVLDRKGGDYRLLARYPEDPNLN